MKNSLCFVLVMVCLALAATPATAATKVFLLAGQSNMGGIGHGRELPGTPLEKYYAPQSDVKMWSNSGTEWRTLSSQFEGSDCMGPEVSFGYEMRAAFPNDDIYLVKWSYGGTSLFSDWQTVRDDGGWCYREFKQTALAAIKTLDDADLAPTVAGMLWMQGEADAANGGFSPTYQANLVSFIAAMRQDFNAPEMPFVLGRILEGYGSPENNATIRTAQMMVPTLVVNTACINTDDLQISPEIPLHYGTQGQIELGIRFADKLTPAPEPSMSMLLLSGAIAVSAGAWKRYK